MTDPTYPVDFAISYAGEDAEVAKSLAGRLREMSFDVFLADDAQVVLTSVDGQEFFERLFSEAKEVVVLLSKHYKRKEWTQFEWDVIRDRDRERRFIPIRLDDVHMLGLPSHIIRLRFHGHDHEELVQACVKGLLLFERERGVRRPSQYEAILDAIRNDSRGGLAKAYQLVKDQRTRTPLEDAAVPTDFPTTQYRIVVSNWHNYSQVRRPAIKLVLPRGLSRAEVLFNLKHCAVQEFNAHKPDAVSVQGYRADTEDMRLNRPFDVGMVEFAPFGEWGKAEEGVAYNIPTSEFAFRTEFNESYFD